MLWLVYDMMRGYVGSTLTYVHVEEIYYLELFLFGWMFDDKIPSIWFKQFEHEWLSSISAIFYTFHVAAPLFVGVLIFYVSKDEETFREYTYSFLLTTYLALLTFFLFPVAPPWYIDKYGFTQPVNRTNLSESAAGLLNVDKAMNSQFFGSIYQMFNANPFAALPSLHSSFAIISVYYFITYYKTKSKLVYLSVIYPIGVWIAAVYLKHHYIVDLVAGALYVFISIWIVQYIQKIIANYDMNEEDMNSSDYISENTDDE